VRHLLKISLIAALIQPFASAQSAVSQKQTASIEGVVLALPENKPLAKASINLRRADERSMEFGQHVITDNDGRFQFEQVKPGRYYLTCERKSYVSQTRADEFRELSLTGNQQIRGIVFHFVLGAVITGRILDKDGEPVPDARVDAEPYRYTKRRNTWYALGGQTDDRGEYRLYSLRPGAYYVMASPSMAFSFANQLSQKDAKKQAEQYTLTYYPGTPDRAQAGMVTLQAGQEAVADFKLATARTVSVSGIVIGAPSKTNSSVAVMLEPRGEIRSIGASAEAQNGKFEMDAVLPGNYLLIAMAVDENRERPLAARQEISVPENGLTGVQVVLSAPGAISGRIVADAGPPAAGYSALHVELVPSEPDTESFSNSYFGQSNVGGIGKVKPDGTFRVDRLVPGTYFAQLTASNPSLGEWYLNSVQLGTQDVTDSGIQVRGGAGETSVILHISAGGASLSGKVVDAEKHPVPNITVAALPPPGKRKRYDLYQDARTDQNGNFTMQGMAPGSYLLLAGEDLDVSDWYDPDAPHPYENLATPIDLRAHEQKAVTITAMHSSEQDQD